MAKKALVLDLIPCLGLILPIVYLQCNYYYYRLNQLEKRCSTLKALWNERLYITLKKKDKRKGNIVNTYGAELTP